MSSVLWIIVVICGYAALTLWLAQCLRAFRTKNKPLAIALLALPVVFCLAIPLGRRLPVHESLILFEACFAAASTLLFRFLSGRQEPLLPARERKPALLQLMLIT